MGKVIAFPLTRTERHAGMSRWINAKAMTWRQKYDRQYQRRPQTWGPLCWNYCQPQGQMPNMNHTEYTSDPYRDSQCAYWDCRCPCHHPENQPASWGAVLGEE